MNNDIGKKTFLNGEDDALFVSPGNNFNPLYSAIFISPAEEQDLIPESSFYFVFYNSDDTVVKIAIQLVFITGHFSLFLQVR